MVDFSKILSTKTDEIKKPTPLPVGTYLCANPQLPEFIESSQKGTPGAKFGLKVIAAGEDVDPDDLAAWQAEQGDYQGKTITHTMWLSEAALYRTKEEVVNAFGIEDTGQTLGEIFNETVNRQVMVSVKHRPSQDGTELYMEVDKLSAA